MISDAPPPKVKVPMSASALVSTETSLFVVPEFTTRTCVELLKLEPFPELVPHASF